MMKKMVIIMAMVVLLCGAPMKSIITLAGENGNISRSSEYSLTVIEDEAVPLSDGSSKVNFYLIYAGTTAIALAAFFYLGKRFQERRESVRKEGDVARMYMDDLIREDNV